MARKEIPGTGGKKFYSDADGDSRPKTDQKVYEKDSSGRARLTNERFNPSTGKFRDKQSGPAPNTGPASHKTSWPKFFRASEAYQQTGGTFWTKSELTLTRTPTNVAPAARHPAPRLAA